MKRGGDRGATRSDRHTRPLDGRLCGRARTASEAAAAKKARGATKKPPGHRMRANASRGPGGALDGGDTPGSRTPRTRGTSPGAPRRGDRRRGAAAGEQEGGEEAGPTPAREGTSQRGEHGHRSRTDYLDRHCRQAAVGPLARVSTRGAPRQLGGRSHMQHFEDTHTSGTPNVIPPASLRYPLGVPPLYSPA